MTISARFLLATLALGATFVARADDFYCGQNIIEEGMEQNLVLQYCGEPSSRFGYHWVYDRSPEQLDILVYFEPDGTVGDIETEMSEQD